MIDDPSLTIKEKAEALQRLVSETLNDCRHFENLRQTFFASILTAMTLGSTISIGLLSGSRGQSRGFFLVGLGLMIVGLLGAMLNSLVTRRIVVLRSMIDEMRSLLSPKFFPPLFSQKADDLLADAKMRARRFAEQVLRETPFVGDGLAKGYVSIFEKTLPAIAAFAHYFERAGSFYNMFYLSMGLVGCVLMLA